MKKTIFRKHDPQPPIPAECGPHMPCYVRDIDSKDRSCVQPAWKCTECMNRYRLEKQNGA